MWITLVACLVTAVVAFFAGREHFRKEIRDGLVDAFPGLRDKTPESVPLIPRDAPTPKTRPRPQQAEPVQLELVRTTPFDLVKYFAEFPDEAEKWASNKLIEFTAELKAVGTNMTGGDRTVIEFEPVRDGPATNSTIQVWFEESFRDRVLALRRGQRVTCTATFSGVQPEGLKLEGTDLRL